MLPAQLDDLDIDISPDTAYIGQTVAVLCKSGMQGPRVTIWLQEITHDLMPDVDSVLLASLDVTNEEFSYNFQLLPQMGPNQAGQLIAILPGAVYNIVVVGSNHIVGLGLRVCDSSPD